ncbi:hypothetical protein KI387_022761, partial [Taxus chinensis]
RFLNVEIYDDVTDKLFVSFGVEKGRNKCRGQLLSINDLGTLKQLKRLELENNGETIRQEMLESMKEMDSLTLKLTQMESLPHDMITMSNMLSDSYWNLKSVEKIRVCGYMMVLDIIEIPIMTKVQTIALSTIDTQAWQEHFREMTDKDEDMLYSEFWSNELLHEWKVIAQLLPGNNMSLDSLEMLGK